jgi:serine phosphatase RsbU (regulator of sigma subunit)
MRFSQLFQPAMKLTDRLKYPQKFALISLLFIMPLSLVMGLFMIELRSRGDTAAKERLGTEYLRVLQPLLVSSPRVALRDSQQDLYQSPSSRLTQERATLTAELEKLSQVDARLGKDLGTADQVKQLQKSWQTMIETHRSLTSDLKADNYHQFEQDLDRLRSTIGNESYLVLDPELESYYLMDAVVTKLPTMQGILAQIKAIGFNASNRLFVTNTERGQLLALVGALKSHNLEFRRGQDFAFQQNKNGQLRSSLGNSVDRFSTQVLAAIQAVNQSPDTSNAASVLKYYQAVEQAEAQSLPLWNQTMDQLDQRLQQRIDRGNQYQLLICTFALLTLASVGYVLVGFYQSVMRTVDALGAASRQMIAGEQTEPVVLDSRDELSAVVASFNQLALALVSSHRTVTDLNLQLEHENSRMGGELDITRRLQEMMLPKQAELQMIPDLDIAGFMKPASEVGGDYYDVLHQDGHVKIGIGDVTGHGLESGMLMVMVQTAVRTLLESHENNPVRFLDILNRTIYGNIQRMESDKNLTLALVDYEDGVLKLSGQHEEMIVVRSGGAVERIDTIDLGFPIGLEENIREFIAETQINLAQGDGVVLYTDGITEAENYQGQQYGIDRLCDVVSENWQQSADDLRHKVVDDLQTFVGDHTVYDDITLLICKKR